MWPEEVCRHFFFVLYANIIDIIFSCCPFFTLNYFIVRWKGAQTFALYFTHSKHSSLEMYLAVQAADPWSWSNSLRTNTREHCSDPITLVSCLESGWRSVNGDLKLLGVKGSSSRHACRGPEAHEPSALWTSCDMVRWAPLCCSADVVWVKLRVKTHNESTLNTQLSANGVTTKKDMG